MTTYFTNKVDASAGRFARAIAAAVELPENATPHERELAQRLQGFLDRWGALRFQLAVVGQFKRGKSSLLNAILGHDVLPTGILPVTALPVFISASPDFELDVVFERDQPQHFLAASASELQENATRFVAESANPANAKHVRRIEMKVPAPLLSDGLVLIDTPGVGSTVQRNTEAAESALPECDAALMVLSPDPPITQAELDYLEKIKNNAAKIVVVFTKTDLASPQDVDLAVNFVRTTLQAAGAAPEIFEVSARRATAALKEKDDLAFAASGIPSLRDRLLQLSGAEKVQLLTHAIRMKANGAVDELLFDNDLVLAALSTPLDKLNTCMRELENAAADFQAERRVVADRLTGDRRRLLQALDDDADATTAKLQARLLAEVASGQQGPRQSWDQVRTTTLRTILTEVKRQFSERHRHALEAKLSEHQARADALLAKLRHTAADLMEVPYRAPPSDTAYVGRFQPFWVDHPRENLGDAPARLIERLLPGPWGRRIAMRRVEAEIIRVATTNIEHLRWSNQLNIEDSFRRFAAELDRTLDSGSSIIGEGLQPAANARLAGEAAAEVLLNDRRQRREILQAAALELKSSQPE